MVIETRFVNACLVQLTLPLILSRLFFILAFFFSFFWERLGFCPACARKNILYKGPEWLGNTEYRRV